MSSEENPAKHSNPSKLLSIVIFVLAVGLMGLLRLHVFADNLISLTYGLPLLVCLWHRDRKLLWSMVAAFVVMSAYRSFIDRPEIGPSELARSLQWAMQLTNIVVIAGAVHALLNLTDQLRANNAVLEAANKELADRAEEIARQNEELEVQRTELAQQNEEIQTQAEQLMQQNEELQQQSEELRVQTDELQSLNGELNEREVMLEALLASVNLKPGGDQPALQQICQSLLDLCGGTGATAVVERHGDELIIAAHAGLAETQETPWRVQNSLAVVVMDYNKTACVEELQARPDLRVPRARNGMPQSILATPLRVDGKPVGTVEVYALEPRQWTKKQFQIVEWVAAQCSLNWEARRLREAMAKANANLENLVRERTAKLQEMIDELEHFSYTITHDMRAPLRAMQGFAGMLQEECHEMRNEQCEDYLRRIVIAADRMDRLITDALSYSKAVRQEIKLSPVDPNQLLKGMVDSYPAFQQPRARIEIEEELPIVLANEAGLTQCFSNLLTNAVKFVPEGRQPHVSIRSQQLGEIVRIWVEDNGIGIPADMQSRIFRMFQRASKDYEGTGIGLALVRKVTERMGGSVGVESELGNGSRFWIELKAWE